MAEIKNRHGRKDGQEKNNSEAQELWRVNQIREQDKP